MRSLGASDWSNRVHSPTVSTSAAEDAIGVSLLLLGWLLTGGAVPPSRSTTAGPVALPNCLVRRAACGRYKRMEDNAFVYRSMYHELLQHSGWQKLHGH